MALLEERLDTVEERTDRLETLFGQFMAQTGIAIRRLDRSIERIDRSVERMEAVIVELRTEAAKDREEWAKAREESAKAREESAKAREESAKAREEAAKERREMNKRWGERANKMGTIVEDIIAPSLRRMAQKEFNCGRELLFTERIARVRSDDPGRRREFDALYIGERSVLLNETKSRARTEDAKAFVTFLRNNEFALYFPEFADLPIVPVFSSLHIPPDLVTYLTRHGVYAVAMGDEFMQILNQAEIDDPTL